MAELHVGSGQQYATLTKATVVAKAGDVIIVHAGVYRETLKPPAGTTWRGAEGEARPVIDGGWNLKAPRDGVGTNARGIGIGAPNVTVSGFEVRNVLGQGVAVGADGDDLLLEDVEIHHTYDGAFAANAGSDFVEGIVIRRVHAHDLCLSTPLGRRDGVNGCFLFKAASALVEDVLIERGYGEGIAAGTRSKGITLRRVVVRNTAHLTMYINRAQDVLVENCVLYQEGLNSYRQSDGDVGDGLILGDEDAGSVNDSWQHAENVTIRGCLVVNTGGLFEMRNKTRPGDKPGVEVGYNTRIQNLVVEDCTFVSGPETKVPVVIRENNEGARVKGVFRHNVFVTNVTRGDDGRVLSSDAPGVQFEDNVWTTAVPAGLPASNLYVPVTALAAPLTRLGEWQFNIDYYRPVAGGPLDGAGVGALAALVSPAVTANFEQSPATGPAPLAVAFTGHSTAEGGAVITSWAWKFGDGATSAEPNSAHTYEMPGEYSVTLTVADDLRSLSHSVVGVVVVTEPEPTDEPEPPVSPWDTLLEIAAAIGEGLAEMATEREAAEASLAKAQGQLAALTEAHDVAAGLLGELLLRLDEHRQGEEELA